MLTDPCGQSFVSGGISLHRHTSLILWFLFRFVFNSPLPPPPTALFLPSFFLLCSPLPPLSHACPLPGMKERRVGESWWLTAASAVCCCFSACHVCISLVCAGAHGGQRRALNAPELELETVDLVLDSELWLFWKDRQCASP